MSEPRRTRRIDVTKPVYIFLMRTTQQQHRDANTDATDVSDVITSYLTSLDNGDVRDMVDDQTTLAIRGSTLPFGTWSSPKVSIRIAKGCPDFQMTSHLFKTS